MKTDFKKTLLQDEEIVGVLKGMILDKAKLHDTFSKKTLSEKEIGNLLEGRVSPEGIKKILEHSIAKEELDSLSQELSSMCFHLNIARGKIKPNKDWERKYHYAKQEVQIENVVRSLLGATNLDRNIKCPFHEDDTPSLKIYKKNNFFVCFGCNARGSPVDFVMKYENCSFKEAVLYLSNL